MKRGLAASGIIALVLLCACGNRQPENAGKVLPPEKMQAVMWDILQADAFTQNFIKKDSSRKDSIENAALQKKIFALHKVSREDYYASYQYYSALPAEMKKILDSMSAKGERERSKMMEQRYGRPDLKKAN